MGVPHKMFVYRYESYFFVYEEVADESTQRGYIWKRRGHLYLNKKIQSNPFEFAQTGHPNTDMQIKQEDKYITNVIFSQPKDKHPVDYSLLLTVSTTLSTAVAHVIDMHFKMK